MDYPEAVRYLDSFIDYEKIGYKGRELFNLERMWRLAEIFNNPQDSFPVIHISGTKGKGSIASFISGILKEAGFNVGLYTSPHLIEPRERIKINNETINEDDFAFCAGGIKRKLDSENLGFSPTYFEIYTLLAFNYFKAEKIDFGVIEVGLGGRLDATNIVKPLISVVTPISYDHTHILGNSLEKIAFEKSGIIKTGCVVISAPQEEEALEVIRKKCESLNTPLILVGRDVGFKEIYHDSEKEIFDIRGIFTRYKHCTSRLLGRHQVINAACAVAAIESLEKTMSPSTDPNQPRRLIRGRLTNGIKKGLEKTENPARCEVIARNPYIILDGAQNRASANALKETIKRNFNYKRLILVLGILKEKDIRGVCEELAPLADSVILTKAKIERAEEPRSIARFTKAKFVTLTDSVGEAMEKAQVSAGPEDMILVAGSFFVAGEAWKTQSLLYQHR
ncbi:MAG: folylpolyglutamate synthase/dihydrofolate synthase family protein [Candidatus Omnitrophota bacterium]